MNPVEDMTVIELTVNGVVRQLRVNPDTPLLTVLRNDLGLKGPKMGCGSEQCGACKVLVDGQAVPSCQLPVAHVRNLSVITVEGLGTGDVLHPLQEAFLEEQAGQCGYCMAGMIIAAQGLLNRERYPTDDQIREALADNLCRCGVYDRVRRAIKLRIGRPDLIPTWHMRDAGPLTDEQAGSMPHSRSLLGAPNIDDWLRFESDASLTLFTGKVELGQGLKTALAQIAADELDVALSRIRVIMADTAQTPDEGLTVGSMSLETSGNAIRLAAAEARRYLLALAVEELETFTPPEELIVKDGVVSDPATGRSGDYWTLMGGRRFGQSLTGRAIPKGAHAYQLVGRPVRRLDLPAKVSGGAAFVHDLELPNMVHGRVVRPPHLNARLVSVDEAGVVQLPGVLRVVRDGSFLGVIAEREDQVEPAVAALRESAVWQGRADLPAQAELYANMLAADRQSFLLEEGTPTAEPVPPVAVPAGAASTIRATYRRPYQMHASLGPSAAVAEMTAGRLTVWAHTQGVFPPQANLAHVLCMPVDMIRVLHVEGAGCYGHNGADDAALDAALLARAFPGRPVALKWSREDEHLWEPYGPPAVMQMQASLSEDGTVMSWNHDVFGYSFRGRAQPGGESSGLLAAWYLAKPFDRPAPEPSLGRHVGIHRNADPLYAFENRRVVKHFLSDSPLRTSSLRGLGAFANVFAIESFMDELAFAAGEDPLAFRLRHLQNARARAVLQAVAEVAEWQPRQARGQWAGQAGGRVHGRGIAFAQYKNQQCYAALVVDLTVDQESGAVHLEQAVIAADAGQVVNPDGLSNQLEGGFVQAASWALKEEVMWNKEGVTTVDWESYPILTFPEAPRVQTVLLNRPGLPFLGSGEALQGPTPGAIANAIFDATGARVRDIPFTRERVLAAIANADGEP